MRLATSEAEASSCSQRRSTFQPPAQFEGSFQLRRFGRAYAVDLRQLLHRAASNALQAAELAQQLLRRDHHRLAPHPTAQDQRQYLLCRESFSTETC